MSDISASITWYGLIYSIIFVGWSYIILTILKHKPNDYGFYLPFASRWNRLLDYLQINKIFFAQFFIVRYNIRIFVRTYSKTNKISKKWKVTDQEQAFDKTKNVTFNK